MVSPADELTEALARAGVTAMFGLPGGGANLDVVGAGLDRGIDFVLAHGENAAAIMAATHGLLTRTPTPVVVTRGPGATSVANGAAQATLDRFPLVVITDTVAQADRERVAHQRIDQRALFAPITKRSARLGADASAPSLQELTTAPTRWPYGAVHVDYDPASATAGLDSSDDARGGGGHDFEAARALIAASHYPLVLVGMEAAALGGSALSELLGNAGLPVLSTYQAVGLIPTESDIGAGIFTNGALEAPVLDQADLLITIGLDIVEPIPAPWDRTVPLIALSTGDAVSPYFPTPNVVLHGDMAEATAQILPSGLVHDTSWHAASGAEFREAARTRIVGPASANDFFGPLELVKAAISALPSRIVTTVDAGAHFLAVMPLWPATEPFDLLISNGLATMGFAVPAAIGAAVARPDRPVLAMTGDGGLGMTMAELETIVRLNLPITVVVFNDSLLSLIKIKQRPEHGGQRAVGYLPTNFAAVAEASGMPGLIVDNAEALVNALSDGWDQPRLIDARIDPAPYARLISVTRG